MSKNNSKNIFDNHYISEKPKKEKSMLTIDNTTLAVGTVASGAAAANVLYQHKGRINKHLVKPAENLLAAPFREATYKNISANFSKLKDLYKSKGFKAAAGKVFDKSKNFVVDTATSAWKNLKTGVITIAEKTKWSNVGKVAGIAAAAAGVGIILKGVWDVVDFFKGKNS